MCLFQLCSRTFLVLKSLEIGFLFFFRVLYTVQLQVQHFEDWHFHSVHAGLLWCFKITEFSMFSGLNSANILQMPFLYQFMTAQTLFSSADHKNWFKYYDWMQLWIVSTCTSDLWFQFSLGVFWQGLCWHYRWSISFLGVSCQLCWYFFDCHCGNSLTVLCACFIMWLYNILKNSTLCTCVC